MSELLVIRRTQAQRSEELPGRCRPRVGVVSFETAGVAGDVRRRSGGVSDPRLHINEERQLNMNKTLRPIFMTVNNGKTGYVRQGGRFLYPGEQGEESA